MICLGALLGGTVTASAMNKEEKNALDVVYRYLSHNNYTCEYDSSDESLNFRHRGTLYWITFNSATGGEMLYTLHKVPLVVVKEGENENQANLSRENAVVAANALSAADPYKAFLSGNKIVLEFPNYASSPEEYTKILMSLLRSMESSKGNFNIEMQKAALYTDSIHDYWSTSDRNFEVLPQQRKQDAGSPLYVNRIEFRNVDAEGKAINDYSYPLNSSQMEYLQARVNIQAKDKTKGNYILTVKITDPDGKVIVEDTELNFSFNSIVDIKNTKAQDYELSSFGTSVKDFWKPGIYKIAIYNEGENIFDQMFTIQDR